MYFKTSLILNIETINNVCKSRSNDCIQKVNILGGGSIINLSYLCTLICDGGWGVCFLFGKGMQRIMYPFLRD